MEECFRVFEVVNGDEVKWGFRKEIHTNSGEYIYITTPLFENMVDEEGKDKQRVVFENTDCFVLHGKLNGSEVLCRVSKDATRVEDFYRIDDFGGKNIQIRPYANGTALIETHYGDLPECFFYDLEKERCCSNIMNRLYDNNFFLKCYRFGDKVRVFMGHLNYNPIIVKHYGCDANKNDVIMFPLDDSELIDEQQMMDKIQKDEKKKSTRTISIAKYQEALQGDFHTALFKLGIHEFGIMTRINKYEDYEDKDRRAARSVF